MKTHNLSEADRAASKAFGRRLRSVMGLMGMTQTEFARRLGGYASTALSRLCRGEVVCTPVNLMVGVSQWADDSGISVLWLLTGRGEMLMKGAP